MSYAMYCDIMSNNNTNIVSQIDGKDHIVKTVSPKGFTCHCQTSNKVKICGHVIAVAAKFEKIWTPNMLTQEEGGLGTGAALATVFSTWNTRSTIDPFRKSVCCRHTTVIRGGPSFICMQIAQNSKYITYQD